MGKYTPHTDNDLKEMMESIGISGIDELFEDIPDKLRPASFDIDRGKTEYEVFRILKNLADKNKSGLIPFLGGGYYDHYIPAVVDAVSSRSEFLTAYTPYQPEASQGMLQAIFEYQTMISGITGLEYSNASLYDGGTALYEAIAMSVRLNRRRKIIIDRGVNPLFSRIVKTYSKNLEIEIVETDLRDIYTDKKKISSMIDEDISAVVVQNPNFFGIVEDYEELFDFARSRGAAGILVFYPLSLGILKTPGEMKADIAVGEGQSLGLPLSFGGPYLGVISAGKSFVRKLPGRIAGETVDRDGNRAYVLTLQAREQHIRREKATSNICSNQALCAVRAAVYLSLYGKEGFKDIALLNLERAEYLKKMLTGIKGVEVREGPTFNEFTVALPTGAKKIIDAMMGKGYLAGLPASIFYKNMSNYLIISATEKRTDEEISGFTEALREVIK